MTVVEIIAIILGIIGCIFLLASFFGIVSFPDFYTRLHAQGVGDTLGLLFILLAMALCMGFKLISLKYLLIFIVTLVTNPLGTGILLQAVSHKDEYHSEPTKAKAKKSSLNRESHKTELEDSCSEADH